LLVGVGETAKVQS